jgi:hypothetical protein
MTSDGIKMEMVPIALDMTMVDNVVKSVDNGRL